MGGAHHDISFKATAEQRSLLGSTNYTLRPLSSSGILSTLKVLEMTWQSIAIFIFSTLILSTTHSAALCGVVLFALVIFPFMELAVLLLGIVSTAVSRGVKWRAAMFWTWWPFWKLMMCVGAAVAGVFLGNLLWNNYYQPDSLLSRMQVYDNVSPEATGLRLQDAGLITFNSSAGVDRKQAGCLKNGVTICVAPIVPVEQQGYTRIPGKLSHYDLFMVGIDCCECPGDFRCGDWNVPAQKIGGVRVLSAEQQKQFFLATQEYAASFGKVVKNPIFFQWNNDPAAKMDSLVKDANSTLLLALLCVPLALVVLVTVLNGILQLLTFFLVIGPHQPIPMPTDGLVAKLSKQLHPNIHSYSQPNEQQASYVTF